MERAKPRLNLSSQILVMKIEWGLMIPVDLNSDYVFLHPSLFLIGVFD